MNRDAKDRPSVAFVRFDLFARWTSQSFTVRSSLPETSCLPSLLKATDQTSSLWSFKTLMTLPVVTSQSWIVRSQPPEAIM